MMSGNNAEKINKPERPQQGGYKIEDSLKRPRHFLAAGVVLLFLAVSVEAEASSPAALNEEGNRHFAEGRYADAEKAYRAALVRDPEKPEILYNLGNSLIRQGNFAPGIQALRRAAASGDRGVQKKGWYNMGIAHFLTGRFSEAAASFIETLKLDPDDQDAKHNLELSLTRISPRHRDDSADELPPEKMPGVSGYLQEPPQAENEHPGRSMSKEETMRLLDAFHQREIEEQRQLLRHRLRQNSDRKDW
ncbi:MAG TPA: tetratricopeptide repeat protein [Acidobacteriota bacterium]|nr:tetratricopeptide repeat protein [Acidobacteriota bacterium]